MCYYSTDAEKAIFRSSFVAKERQISTGILREREKIPLKRPTKASDLPCKLPKHRKERGLEAQIGVCFVHARLFFWFDCGIRGRIERLDENFERREEER